MKYTAIRSEGGLIPDDVLQKIAAEEVPGQKASEFALPKGRRLSDEIQRVWSDAQDLWDIFRRRTESLPEKDPYGTTLTRERWIVPLLSDPQILGYELKFQSSAIVLDGLTFPISHRAGEPEESPPVDIEGFKVDLDHRGPKLRTSPRAMVQEFLNHSEEHLWGIVTNGYSFRLIRDTARTSRPTYLEFDLESILEGGLFNEFSLFYRLCHRSRLPRAGEPAEECLLEKYYQLSIEQGGRVRDKLRDGVEEGLLILGTGLLRHPENHGLREKFKPHGANAQDFHRQLLRLIYRLLFLIVAEERRMIVATGENSERNQSIYREYYSVSRLRERAEGIIESSDFSDLWLGLKQTFSLFSDTSDKNPLDIPPLNGDLFSSITMPDLDPTQLLNQDLLLAIRKLSLFSEGKVLQRVNYSALDVEELGSVYESLLEYRPAIEPDSQGPEFKLETGSERKTTGSYYTRPELVRELIHSALEPVLEDRLQEAAKDAKAKGGDERTAREKMILSITVCDPACGSGHFLLEAARRLGKELARVRTGEDEPSPEQFHLAVRDVVSHCIYGVDLNPLAVDLCKLALWLEGHWTGKPLSFLDHRIKCGNSLIGVFGPELMATGIPDDAFNPVTGDDKKIASDFKKRNRNERIAPARQQTKLDFEPTVERHLHEYAALAHQLTDMTENQARDVRRKAGIYEESRSNVHWYHDALGANAWTAAFFVPLQTHNDPRVPTHETFLEFFQGRVRQPQFIPTTQALATKSNFFHWFLEFPEVFEKGGFDVIIGNPPWERIKLQEEEHWSDDSYISNARNKAEREKRLEEYRRSSEPLKMARILRFDAAKHLAEATSKFIRGSKRFPLTAVGDVNTYALFAELFRCLIKPDGRAGILLPTGIATDDTTKIFFGALMEQQVLVSLTGFENEAFIFPAVHHAFKFCAMTIAGEQRKVEKANFIFFCRHFEQLRESDRHFQLSREDLSLLNPNTGTCPVFRSRADADLTKKIYRRVPVLAADRSQQDSWDVRFMTMFHMANDSELFFSEPQEGLLPLYEAKMIWQFDHRHGSYEGRAERGFTNLKEVDTDRLNDPNWKPLPFYWVAESEVLRRLVHIDHSDIERLEKMSAEEVQSWYRGRAPDFLIGFRDVTNATNERTTIFSLLPRVAVGHTVPLTFFTRTATPSHIAFFLASMNSLVLDYVARQKIGGMHLTYGLLNQLPIYALKDCSPIDLAYVSPRVLELTYTAWDMEPFARNLGHVGNPFPWDESRRGQVRSELDAYFANLYGLTRDELRYILLPKEVLGEDYPSETFRVLKEKEEKQYGEYRTRRLVLAAFDEVSKSERFRGEKRDCTITGKTWTVGD